MKSILIENYDYEFYSELYKKGLTVKTIALLRDSNIRREIILGLSNAEFNEIGISTIGDKIILKRMI